MQTSFILPLWPLEGYLTPMHTYFLKQFDYRIHDVILEAIRLVLCSPAQYTADQVAACWNTNQLGNRYVTKMADVGTRWTLDEAVGIYRTILTAVYTQLYFFLREAVRPVMQPASLGNAWLSNVRYHFDGVEMTLNVEYMSF